MEGLVEKGAKKHICDQARRNKFKIGAAIQSIYLLSMKAERA